MEAKVGTRRHLGVQAWCEVFRRFDGGGDSVVAWCSTGGSNTGNALSWVLLIDAIPVRVR